MKRNILIVPRHIKSHLIPALYLAELLSPLYDVHFAVSNNELENIARSNGYNCIKLSNLYLGEDLEKEYLTVRKKSNHLLNRIKTILTNKIYKYRTQEYEQIISRISPAAIFIDIFASADCIITSRYARVTKTFLFNPMLSLRRNIDYPDVRGKIGGNQVDNTRRIFIKPDILNDMMQRLRANKMKTLIRKSPLKKFDLSLPNKFSFDNIKEFILAPAELEYNQPVVFNNQIYCGFAIAESRIDIETDSDFDTIWDVLLSQKNKHGKKIVYCSFGTYYRNDFDVLYRFLVKLAKSIAGMENVLLVCAVHQYVHRTVSYLNVMPENIFFFHKVPQLKVLASADLFITHGGLGSVKEAILHQVPMFVFPLDEKFDQNGNALKVEFHKVGVKGSLKSTSVEIIRSTIQKILFDEILKDSVVKMNRIICSAYSKETLFKILQPLIED